MFSKEAVATIVLFCGHKSERWPEVEWWAMSRSAFQLKRTGKTEEPVASPRNGKKEKAMYFKDLKIQQGTQNKLNSHKVG